MGNIRGGVMALPVYKAKAVSMPTAFLGFYGFAVSC